MERQLEVGPTLGEVFYIYRAQVGVLLPIAFWLFLAVAIINELTERSIYLFWISMAVSIVAPFLYQGMVVRLVEDVQDGRRDSSIGDLVRSVVPVLWRLIGAGFLVGLGVVGGLILLVVPGLYLLTTWAVVAPVIVVERRRVFDALGRSRVMIRGNGWPVFWVVAIAFVFGTLVAVLFVLLIHAAIEGDIVRVVFSVLAQTVTAPVEGLVASVLYFRLRAIQGEQPSPARLTAPEPPLPSA